MDSRFRQDDHAALCKFTAFGKWARALWSRDIDQPARPAGTRSRAPLPAPFLRRRNGAVGGWENRSEALAKGFIQVGWAVELPPEQRSGARLNT